VTQLWWN